jgi:hypothetical protein
MRTAFAGAAMLALVLTCGTAEASDWLPIGKSEDGKQQIFVDTSSIRIDADIRRAWIKTILTPHAVRGLFDDANKWVTYELNRDAFNCMNEAYRFEAQTEYYEDGSNYSVPASNYPSTWAPVPPDTVADNLMRVICAWKPR